MEQIKSNVQSTEGKEPIYKSLHFQVFAAIILGIAFGHFYPSAGASMRPLGDGFIKLIKMIIDRKNAPYTGTSDDFKRVDAIFNRIEALNGINLSWA